MTTELTDEQRERIKEESNIMSLDVDTLRTDTLEHPDYVHKDRLRELVEQWRWNFEEDMGVPEWNMAANQLEEVIDDE